MNNMPFDKKSASVAGKAGGVRSAATRWGDKDPSTVRNKSLRLTISQPELEAINAKAKAHGLSRVELLVRAAIAYDG